MAFQNMYTSKINSKYQAIRYSLGGSAYMAAALEGKKTLCSEFGLDRDSFG